MPAPRPHPLRIGLLLAGFGHVGRRFVSLLGESRDRLDALGVQPVVAGIVTRRHGGAFDAGGLDAARAAADVAAGRAIGSGPAVSVAGGLARLARAGFDATALVETTPLDVGSGEPAISHVRAAFAAGAGVITANKGPVAFAYRALAREAGEAGVPFLFEGAVMDGVPVFSLVRETLPAATILGFRGVVNSTTNHILTALEEGEGFDEALARMQAAGVAEADPSLDVEGWDAAAKTAALANVLLDADLTPRDVPREAVNTACASRARAARAARRRLKVVARAARAGERVEATVELVELPADDPLATLDGQANALELDTWPLGRLVITQRDGGLEKTAYALVADLATLARRARERR